MLLALLTDWAFPISSESIPLISKAKAMEGGHQSHEKNEIGNGSALKKMEKPAVLILKKQKRSPNCSSGDQTRAAKKGKTPATFVRNLSLEHERVLGEKHSSALEDPTIYSVFFDVLSVNRDDAFRYIANKPFMYQPNIPEDAAYLVRAFEEIANGVQAKADHQSTPELTASNTIAGQSPRKPPKPEVTQEEAADLAKVGVRTIHNWDKGIRAPNHYPGRQSKVALKAFIERRESDKRYRDAAEQ